jgi:hypothetical protein
LDRRTEDLVARIEKIRAEGCPAINLILELCKLIRERNVALRELLDDLQKNPQPTHSVANPAAPAPEITP